MAVAENAKNQAEAKARHAAANPWVERLARFGYAVRGILYAVVGLLAVQVALGAGGATTDKNGAIATIGSQPTLGFSHFRFRRIPGASQDGTG